MRLAITILGHELIVIETTPAEQYEAEEQAIDGGYLTSMPLGFVANHERPEESGLPYREGWGE